jgi:hypothetical protein
MDAVIFHIHMGHRLLTATPLYFFKGRVPGKDRWCIPYHIMMRIAIHKPQNMGQIEAGDPTRSEKETLPVAKSA